MNYVERTALTSIKKLMSMFPCVSILGARQIGKTVLLKQFNSECIFFDLEKQTDLQKMEEDPYFFLSQFHYPIIIDESQNLPMLFPSLRILIDKSRSENGQFLLSGSSSPLLLKNITESLAGRIAILELQGFSLEEQWQLKPSPFYEFFKNNDIDVLLKLEQRFSIEQIIESIINGQYPELVIKKENKDFRDLWIENYLNTYIKRDIRNLFAGLNIRNYQKFISMLFTSSGEIINYSNYARSLDTSVPTIKNYFEIAAGTFFWRLLPSYDKNLKKRIIKMPKGHIRDTGLICHMVNIKTKDNFFLHPNAGNIWEIFIIEEILKNLTNRLIRHDVYYYRTQHQAKIDLIIEGSFGTIPVEIKLGQLTRKKHIVSLSNFIKEQNLKLGLVINLANKVEWLAPGILQVPATFL